MLDPFNRGAIVALSAACVAGGFALAPLGARSSSRVLTSQPSLAPAATNPPAPAAAAIRRDPFALPAPTATPATPEIGAATRRRGGDLEPLASNVPDTAIPDVPGMPASAAPGLRITAIVTGAHPYALIEQAGVHAIKGIGDRIGDVPITSIDLGGITLRGGQRLTVDADAGR